MVLWDEASDVEFIKGPSICQVQALFKIDIRSDFLHSRCLDFFLSELIYQINLLTNINQVSKIRALGSGDLLQWSDKK